MTNATGANFSQHFRSSDHHNMRTVDEREEEEHSSEFRGNSRTRQFANNNGSSNGRAHVPNEWKENVPQSHAKQGNAIEGNAATLANASPNGTKVYGQQKDPHRSVPLSNHAGQYGAPISGPNKTNHFIKPQLKHDDSDESIEENEEESLNYGDDNSDSEEESVKTPAAKKPSLLAILEARRNLLKAETHS